MTINLFEAIKKTGLDPRVVIGGTAAEYGVVYPESLPITELCLPNPQSPYGMTKLWQTHVGKYYAHENFSVVIARMFNIIGTDSAKQLSTGDFFAQIARILQNKQGRQVFAGNLQLRRDFLDIDDVCSGLVALAMRGKSNEVYNICSSYSVSLQNILELCLSEIQLNVKIVIDHNKMQNTYVQDIYGCNEKIKKDTGWNPVIQLLDSIRKVLNIDHEVALLE